MEQNGESKSYTPAHIHTHWFLTKGQGGFLSGTSSKEPACQCRTHAFNPWVKKIPWRRKWHPTSVFLSGKIPRTEELGGLQSIEPLRAGHDWAIERTHIPKVIQWRSILFFDLWYWNNWISTMQKKERKKEKEFQSICKK